MSLRLDNGVQGTPQLAVTFDDAKRDSETPIAAIKKGLEDLNFLIKTVQDNVLPQALEASRNNAAVANELLERDFPRGSGKLEQLKNANAHNLPMMNTLKGYSGRLKTVFDDLATQFRELSERCITIELASEQIKLECLHVTTVQEKPVSLADFSKRCQDLKSETSSDRALVDQRHVSLWKTAFAQLTEIQKQFHARPEDGKNEASALSKFIRELDEEIKKTDNPDRAQFALLEKTIPVPVLVDLNRMSAERKKNCRDIKESSVRYWNNSLLDLIIIETHLYLIDNYRALPKEQLDLYSTELKALRKDIDHVKNVYRGDPEAVKAELERTKPENEKAQQEEVKKDENKSSPVGNHAYFCTQFKLQSKAWEQLKSKRKNLKDTIQGLKKSSEMIERFSRLDSLAFATSDHPLEAFTGSLKTVVEEQVKKPIAEMEAAYTKLFAEFSVDWDAIALDMDRAEAVVEHPEWAIGNPFWSLKSYSAPYPSPTLFKATQALSALSGAPKTYDKYTKFRDQLKD